MRMPSFVILSALVAGALSLSTFSHTPPRPMLADMHRAAQALPVVQSADTSPARTSRGETAAASTSLARAFAAPPQQATPAVAQAPNSPASTHVIHMLENDGPRQTARVLTQNRKWSDVRQAVSTGQPEAALMLTELLPQADPATARSLRTAMRRALPVHPAAVLAAMDQTDGPLSGARTVCTPQGMSRAWQSNARKAVAGVHDIHLITRARDCLTRLGGLPQAG